MKMMPWKRKVKVLTLIQQFMGEKTNDVLHIRFG